MTVERGPWRETTLGQIAAWGSGGTPNTKDSSLYGGHIPWAVIGDLTEGFVHRTAASITEAGLAHSSAKLVPEQAVLVAMYGASIGRVGITAREMATNQAIAHALPNESVSAKYLMYYLMSQREHLVRAGKGAAQPNIGQGVLKAWPIRLPLVDEQRRIVDLLEDHLSRLDAAEGSLERSLRRLNTMRDSALARSVSEALASTAGATVTLGEIAKVTSGLTPLKGNKAFYEDGTVPWITSGDLHQGLVTVAKQFVTERALEETSLKLVPAGALLVAMYGEGKTRGTAAELGIAASTNQACAAVTLQDTDLRSWVRLVLDANYLGLRRLASGGVQPNLNLSLIRAIKVPLPPASTRSAVLNRMSEIDEARLQLSDALREAHVRGSALRRSLLTAAFSGRLTSDSADLSVAEEMIPA